jgi:2-C-methyl-D-erythritol 4-phosphate cytidylyltransferase
VSDLRWAAVIVAAGRGERFGRPKQLVDVAGLPMVGWSLRAFAEMPEIVAVVVVTEEPWIEPMRELFAQLAPAHEARVMRGGTTRQESVRNGLHAVPPDCEAVLVHDGARPLVRAGDVRAAMREVRAGRAALLTGPIVDTMKVIDPRSRRVTQTVDRETMRAAQTPQLATLADMWRAHDDASRGGIEATDDATLLERIGIEVVAVDATGENFKVTMPADVTRAEALLHEQTQVRP